MDSSLGEDLSLYVALSTEQNSFTEYSGIIKVTFTGKPWPNQAWDVRHSLPSCLFVSISDMKYKESSLSVEDLKRTKWPLRISSNSKDSMSLISGPLNAHFCLFAHFYDDITWTKYVEMLFSKPPWPVEDYFFPTASNKEHLLLHPLLYPKGTKQEGAQMCHTSEGGISLMQRRIISKPVTLH